MSEWVVKLDKSRSDMIVDEVRSRLMKDYADQMMRAALDQDGAARREMIAVKAQVLDDIFKAMKPILREML